MTLLLLLGASGATPLPAVGTRLPTLTGISRTRLAPIEGQSREKLDPLKGGGRTP